MDTVTRVGSHSFISADDNVDCLRCGGEWEVDSNDDAVAANGDYAVRCTSDDVHHGDPRETGHDLDCAVCDAHDVTGVWCAAVDSGCNCLFCC